MDMRNILVLNGPSLNLLGTREPAIYGSETLADLEARAMRHGADRGARVTCLQSNSEGELVDIIHAARNCYDGIVYNPGAHTHYSYALRDAIASIEVPVVEVHLSDVDSREAFRRVSVIAPVCVARVKGMGADGYCRAIDILFDNVSFNRLGENYAFPSDGHVVVGCEREKSHAQPRPAILEDEPSASDAAASPGLAATSAARRDAVQEACLREGLRGLLVRDTSNICWITAIDGVFDEERAHALLVADGSMQLHTDSRYANAVRTAVARMGGILDVSEERQSHGRFAFDALKEVPGAQDKLGIEDTITYAEFLKMSDCFGGGRLVPTTDLVLNLRAVKDADEIARLRAAQAVTDAAFLHIRDFMRPGMTEREVQLELEDFMVRNGGEGLAFRSIVATGANGADPHAVPGSARLEAGQCVVMDFGAKAHGYCSDMTRTVFLGQPEGEMLAAWETLRRANESVEDFLKPGVTGAQAHELAERILEEGGFGGKMGHGLGHGVGLEIHELPVLNPRNEKPLVAGNVVTVEPGIYLRGKFGMRLEDCGVITDAGYEAFTKLSHELVVI